LDLEALQVAARNGDKQAEGQFLQFLTARFRLFTQLKIAEREEAEDVCQDALTTVLTRYKAIDFEVGFSAWAHGVLQKKILTYYRSKATHERKMNELATTLSGPAAMPADTLLESRLLDCLRKIHAVHQRHARILNLNYQGFSVDHICRKLAVTRTNLYSLLSRARDMLERCLETGEIRK
jgi:RNA polymerase sigma factor (sigma-70 family)